MSKKGKTQANMDWENRTLCSDGNCIGVIGHDGRCKECGKPYEGDLPWLREADSSNEDPKIQGIKDENQKSPGKENRTSGHMDQTKSDVDSEWENRILCSDGNCIGIIGPDGLCKECGKPLEK